VLTDDQRIDAGVRALRNLARYRDICFSDWELREAVRAVLNASAHSVTEVILNRDCPRGGKAIANRPGLQDLIALVREHGVEAVIAESTSRISRDQEYRARFRKILRFYDVEFITVADGVVTDFARHFVGHVLAVAGERDKAVIALNRNGGSDHGGCRQRHQFATCQHFGLAFGFCRRACDWLRVAAYIGMKE